jgi:aryl-alcohol dehydrogenase-like predicted oxidoreductase
MGGFLTGKYSKHVAPPIDSRGKYNPAFWERVNKEKNFSMLEKFTNIAKVAGVPLRQLALSWILKNETITAAIVGASTAQQMEDNCQITELPADVCKKLDETAA